MMQRDFFKCFMVERARALCVLFAPFAALWPTAFFCFPIFFGELCRLLVDCQWWVGVCVWLTASRGSGFVTSGYCSNELGYTCHVDADSKGDAGAGTKGNNELCDFISSEILLVCWTPRDRLSAIYSLRWTVLAKIFEKKMLVAKKWWSGNYRPTSVQSPSPGHRHQLWKSSTLPHSHVTI